MTEASGPLATQALAFAEDLTVLVQLAIPGAQGFEVVEVGDQASRLRVVPRASEWAWGSLSPMIELPREADDPNQPRPLYLSVQYLTSLDDEGEHLTVQSSTFGLWVYLSPEWKRPRPLLRVEYDRAARNKPAAHVHFHAESAELGWIYGSAGQALPRFDELHYPVGGRRFRPTLEEVLLFLDREGLYGGWQDPSWKNRASNSLGQWEARQAAATVRRFPEASAQQLERMGFEVTRPRTEGGAGQAGGGV